MPISIRAVLDRSLTEGREFLRVLQSRGIRWVCLTAGSPYYCPHVVRPALFPPADGYEPPEDPLRGVARQIRVTAMLKSEFPDMVFVGSAYTYLQEWLPNVGQYTLRHGMTDFVGLGRMMLSYPELAADVLEGKPLTRKLVCRTFSDCTTGPRLGLVSGCYPLDPLYVAHPARARPLKEQPRRRPPGHESPSRRALPADRRRPDGVSLALRRRRLRACTACRASIRISCRSSAGRGNRSRRGTPTARSSSRWRSGFSPGGSWIASARAGCMLGGIVMAGGALVGLSYVTSLGAFYFFYTFNALGYVFGGPLPNQVLLSRWFDKGRGKAMGIAYLGIGVGGALVPLLAFALTQAWGWRGALRILGLLMIAIALPMAYFVREPARAASAVASAVSLPSLKNILTAAGVLFPDARQHGVDRRRRRDDSESRALSQPRSQAAAGRDRHDALDHPRRAASSAA